MKGIVLWIHEDGERPVAFLEPDIEMKKVKRNEP